MRIVLAAGCFDCLHPGHVRHLQEARSMGDFLIVALTLDQFVNKGPDRPIHRWNDRAFLLRSLRCVDHVIPAADGTDTIMQVRPHIFVKGVDCKNNVPQEIVDACKLAGAQLKFTTSPKMSTTDLLKRLHDS